MEIKRHYSAREVAALTGLTARQLQWWDASGLVAPTIAPRRTEAGGFTERRYSPMDLIELMALATLRRHGVSLRKIRQLLDILRAQFGVRLFETIGEGGRLTLMTDGTDVYARTTRGELFNLLRSADQPLLVLDDDVKLRALTARARKKRGKRKKEEDKK
jgi:DNA-binding transcriptional MerR regulator